MMRGGNKPYLLIPMGSLTNTNIQNTRGEKFMFCKNCGNEVSQNEKFCRKCGTPTGIVDPAQTNLVTTPSNGVNPVMIMGIIMVVLLFLQIIFLYNNSIKISGSASAFGYSYSQSETFSVKEMYEESFGGSGATTFITILALLTIIITLGETFGKIKNQIVCTIIQISDVVVHIGAITILKYAFKTAMEENWDYGIASLSATYKFNGFLTLIDILLIISIVAMIALQKKKTTL